MAQLNLPKALARYTNGSTDLKISGATLQDILVNLTAGYNLGTAVLRGDGTIQPYIGVVMGGQLLNKATLLDLQSISVADQSVQLKIAFAGG